jgi:hypothetical protein
MLLKLIYVQDLKNLMVDYEYYIQDILESTKQRHCICSARRWKRNLITVCVLNTLGAMRFEGCDDCARRLLPGCSLKKSAPEAEVRKEIGCTASALRIQVPVSARKIIFNFRCYSRLKLQILLGCTIFSFRLNLYDVQILELISP